MKHNANSNMNQRIILVLFALICAGPLWVISQEKKEVPAKPKVEVYYFHPNERCPIDQSIEENLRKLMQTSYAKEMRDGTIRFRVVNTDDKANQKFAGGFDINAQALYILSQDDGKEVRNNLTEFAFAYGLSNVEKFKAGIREEIDNALKSN